MADKIEYYNKILEAWITKMKDKGFKFTINKARGGNGIELEYHRSDGNTNICVIADHKTSTDQLFDRLHKLELLIHELAVKPKLPIRSIALGYFPSYYNGPHLIKQSTDLPNNKRYVTYIDNGQFKTVEINA